jgi:uncharacterized protein (TIGR00255 family)
MIKSMTGYGKAEIILPDKKVSIEIKSLNSKNNDTNVKLPYAYRGKELELRQIINEKLQRGKIDINIYYELNAGITPASINKELVKSYFQQLREINAELGVQSDENLLEIVMRLPDTVKVEKNEFEESEWIKIKDVLLLAIEQVDAFRIQEGKALEKDILSNVDSILKGLGETGKYENARIGKIREKLDAQLKELKIKEDMDQNRFEQELIYYLEKMDVSEEKVRLANHCKYFHETLHNDDNAGKKLGFILQEMGREINTLGSKANDSDMQKIVVSMKDDLEKIKEQILNIL